MGGHVDAGVENPNEIVAQVEAKKARNLAVAAKQRLADAPDLPTFAEKRYEFLLGADARRGRHRRHDARGRQVVGRHAQEGDRHQEVAGRLHQAQPAHPVQWAGEEANKYLDGLNGKYEKALGDLGALKKK